jgi:hypothetical protein
MHVRLRNVIAAVGAAALVVVSSSSAGAISPAPVSGGPAGQDACAAQAAVARTSRAVAAFRAFGDCEIGRRQKTLASLSSVVSRSKALSGPDRAALTAEIGSESTGLVGLQATIDGQRSLPPLRLEVVQIASRFRVYALLAPEVYLVASADEALALQASLTQTATALAARIVNAGAGGRDVAGAQTSLNSMNGEIAAAGALAAPLPARLLALTAAQWNLGTAGPVLTSARAALVSARDHLRNAVKFGRAVIAALA